MHSKLFYFASLSMLQRLCALVSHYNSSFDLLFFLTHNSGYLVHIVLYNILLDAENTLVFIYHVLDSILWQSA